ncbi:MAG: hypothetical protein QMC89_03700 [Candidatus Hodarchaeaceae archaeon]|nr:hypothetical protein [Candidatus Hodarchaeaceae archaeon]
MSEKSSDLIADLMNELRHRLNELERRMVAVELAVVQKNPTPEFTLKVCGAGADAGIA